MKFTLTGLLLNLYLVFVSLIALGCGYTQGLNIYQDNIFYGGIAVYINFISTLFPEFQYIFCTENSSKSFGFPAVLYGHSQHMCWRRELYNLVWTLRAHVLMYVSSII